MFTTSRCFSKCRLSIALWAVFVLFGSGVVSQAVAQIDPTGFKRIPPPGWHFKVQLSVAAWNSTYGNHVRALGWQNDGIIQNDAERVAAVAEITDINNAWMPSGDADAPKDMTALRVVDDPDIPAAAIADWIADIDSRVQVGHRRVRIQWEKDDIVQFTTLCIVDQFDIIYGNMISNAAGHGDLPPGLRDRTCLNKRLWWLWEKVWSDDPADWSRGRLWAINQPVCRDGHVISCDFDCGGFMTGGQAEVKCRSTQVGDNCCKMTWNWAWACGFKKVAIGADGYTLSIEGIIGSSGSGNGQCTACCERSNGQECPPDLNGDERVDTLDVVMFFTFYSASDPAADFNQDQTVDYRDAQDFLQAYVRGCPEFTEN